MDKIIIRDLVARGKIGIHDKERSENQEILINIELYTDTRKAAGSDSIKDCVNYSTIAKKVLNMAEENQRQTVEAFAADIAEECLQHPLVQRIKVRVEKTTVVRFTGAVGVEIEREK